MKITIKLFTIQLIWKKYLETTKSLSFNVRIRGRELKLRKKDLRLRKEVKDQILNPSLHLAIEREGDKNYLFQFICSESTKVMTNLSTLKRETIC